MCARTLNLIQIKKRQVVGMGPAIGDMEKTVLGPLQRTLLDLESGRHQCLDLTPYPSPLGSPALRYLNRQGMPPRHPDADGGPK